MDTPPRKRGGVIAVILKSVLFLAGIVKSADNIKSNIELSVIHGKNRPRRGLNVFYFFV